MHGDSNLELFLSKLIYFEASDFMNEFVFWLRLKLSSTKTMKKTRRRRGEGRKRKIGSSKVTTSMRRGAEGATTLVRCGPFKKTLY